MAEFLPLCDVLFTVISLAGYFCDVIFDLVMAWALAGRGKTLICIASLTMIAFSLIVSQIVSLRWYLHTRAQRQSESNKEKTLYRTMTVYLAVILHIFQCGVLWRYAKLFIPVDLRHVKHEVRDLCMLRLMHAFLEAAPMLLLQVYLLVCPSTDLPHSKPFYDLNVVSAVLSLFSVCWALASFSKNVRLQNVHRLVLTWLGVIFQFLWRLGTVSARVTSLTMYASLYGYWIFLVIGLHWFCMFLWLISPKNVFHGERISKPRKAYLSALIAFVYVFAYVNLQEVNHRQKMVTFYVVMLLENSLLITAWLAGNWYDKPADWYIVPLLVTGLFTIGLVFMLLYYRYFHVRRLGYEAGGRLPQMNTNNNYCISCNGICECNENQVAPSNSKLEEIHQENVKYEMSNLENNKIATNRYHQHSIPGVFNCRFSNPVIASVATKRKKKKPTTFVPPPTMTLTQNLGPTSVPFWRRPLPNQHNHQGGSSENEGSSVGSRVNIHQKLQEKKQKQLAELKIIEEEIKQGKLVGPNTNSLSATDETFNSLPRQPIPTTKKHVEPICWPPPSPDLTDLTDLNAYTKNINEYQHNLSEINTNSTNLNKLTSYKQNLNNLNTLNDLNYNSQILNNSLNRMSTNSSPGLNNQPNISSIDPRGNSNEIVGLSPILGSDDSGSLPRKIVSRQLPKKSVHNSRMNRKEDQQRITNNRLQRVVNMSPRNEYKCDNSMLNVRGGTNYQIETQHRESPRREMIDQRYQHKELIRLNSNHSCNYADERNALNISPRMYDATPNDPRLNIHQNEPMRINSESNLNRNQRFTSHSNDSIYNLRLYNDASPKLNVQCGEPRIILCTSHHQQIADINNRRMMLSLDDTNNGAARLSPRDIINLNCAQYQTTNAASTTKNFNPQPRFVPYHVVPPPKTKQNIVNSSVRTQINRSKTPEILLAPHYLDNTRVYYDWGDRCGQSNIYRIHDQHLILSNDDNNSTLQRQHVSSVANNEPNSVSDNENIIEQHDIHQDETNYKVYRAPSDIDSQISLPRSYTLPREFKYYRRNRVRKNTRNDHFIASTNSSDGDVDSGDDNDTDDSVMISIKPPNLPQSQNTSNNSSSAVNNGLRNKMVLRRPYAYRNQVKHETKL
ncbi:probable serine/threonine-protein kinase DDB_G0282963 [Chrysoperla carnea]|uniref:probable serine/threonine-protein kinase DDB_G0282963 n=1 Tax=Chrysoperla carnea TaxID=189513 RepID=UPI001D098CE3|nr:probable serine/threonine-protein kinase DDB_G0282963 [Chrysoperla carnea]